MIDPVMTLYNHVKRNPLHLPKSLATIAKHRAAGRFDTDLALRLLRNNVTDNVRLMVHDRFTIAHVSSVAVMILADSANAVPLYRATTLIGTIIDGKTVVKIGGFSSHSERVDFANRTGKWLTFSEIDALIALQS